MFMSDYGLQVYPAGVVLHRDGRRFGWGPDGFGPQQEAATVRGDRRPITGWSEASRRRFEFIAANCAAMFKSFITLTYHAVNLSWEDDHERNRRVVKDSKKNLNRFRTTLRRELGQHLWVQEFQKRGVIHYHLLCEGEPLKDRCSWVWLKATGELHDRHAQRVAVKVEHAEKERSLRGYLGRYIGKGSQKVLPPGIEGAGRWWGRSRGLKLAMLRQIVTHLPEGGNMRQESVCLLRSFRRWMSGEVGHKVRSGVYIDWRRERSARAVRVVDELMAFYLRELSGVDL